MLLRLVIPLTVVLFLPIVFFCGSLIAWKTKKQVAIYHLCVEAGLRALTLVTTEVTCLWW
jgi:hypothetical protein